MKRYFTNLFILLTSILVILLVLEGLVRLLPDDLLGFEYEDGRFTHAKESTPDRYTNSLGVLDVEPGPKQPGVRRVLLLGDSYVAAITVELEQTVGRRLEHYLNESGGQQYDVVAVGWTGWGQREQLSSLQELGEHLDPDLVITLFLSLNDVRNNHPELEEEVVAQAARISHTRPGWWNLSEEDVPFLWVKSSALNRLVSYRLAVLDALDENSEIPIDYNVYAATWDTQWINAWQATEALLRATKELSESLGARYAIVSASTPHGNHGAEAGEQLLISNYPAMEGREWDLDIVDKRLERFARATSIPFLALEPPFRRMREQGRVVHWPRDGHWNIEGNDNAGRLVAEFALSLF